MAPRAVCLKVRSRSIVIVVVVLLSIFHFSTQQDACEDGKFDCGNGRCIDTSQVCDYFDNCVDELITDEFNCSHPPADMSKVLVCTMTSPTSRRSYVHKLYGNPDDYAYKLGNDTFKDTLPILMNWIHFAGYDFLHSISIDYKSQRIYFGNNLHQRLEFGYFIYKNETFTRYFDFLPESNQLNGVAVDWVTKNIYWADGRHKMIGMKPLAINHRVWKVIVDSGLSLPQDVAVNPLRHYLFWSDGLGNNAKIERSDLSGNSRTILVSSAQGLVSPTTLAVDLSTQKLYWLDADAAKIGRMNFDGSGLFTQIIPSLSQVSAMTVYSNFIYFGNHKEPVIYIHDKASLNQISSYRLRDSGGISDMEMYAPGVQPPASSPCAHNYGGCTHFCFTTSSNAKACDCAPGFFLASDGRRCSYRSFWENEEYIVVADLYQQTVYQLKPSSAEVRALPMNPCHPVSVAFDPSDNVLYVICLENSRYHIQRKTFDGRIDETFYSVPPTFSDSVMVGVAMDAERGMVYYTDKVEGIIGEITTGGVRKRKLFSDRSIHPRAIAVDSYGGRLYWSDCSGPATIQTGRIADEGDWKILIREPQHSCIVDFAIDFDKELVYWVLTNNPAVKVASLDGSGRATLLNESAAVYTGITLYNDSLYIADENRRNVIKYDLASRTMSLQAPGIFIDAYDVKYFTRVGRRRNVTTPRSTSLATTAPGKDDDNWTTIVIVVAVVGGVIVGGLLVLAVVILVAKICPLGRKPESSDERRPPEVFHVQSQPASPVPVEAAPVYTEFPPGAMGGLDKSPLYDDAFEFPQDSDYNHNTQL